MMPQSVKEDDALLYFEKQIGPILPECPPLGPGRGGQVRKKRRNRIRSAFPRAKMARVRHLRHEKGSEPAFDTGWTRCALYILAISDSFP